MKSDCTQNLPETHTHCQHLPPPSAPVLLLPEGVIPPLVHPLPSTLTPFGCAPWMFIRAHLEDEGRRREERKGEKRRSSPAPAAPHKKACFRCRSPKGAAVSAPTGEIRDQPACLPAGLSAPTWDGSHTHTHTQRHTHKHSLTKTPAFDFLHTYIVISTPQNPIHIINTGSLSAGRWKRNHLLPSAVKRRTGFTEKLLLSQKRLRKNLSWCTQTMTTECSTCRE